MIYLSKCPFNETVQMASNCNSARASARILKLPIIFYECPPRMVLNKMVHNGLKLYKMVQNYSFLHVTNGNYPIKMTGMAGDS